MPVEISIITPPQWDARAPKSEPDWCGKASRIIFHHTAGHAPGTGVEAAKQYARDIQRFHMDVRGWNDSGHNFLVCRNGLILTGRWMTVTAIQNKAMVVSAHCPGQNTQIGIEHEHLGNEHLTVKQREASARLQAWVAWKYNRSTVLPVDPHSKYFATACPANLVDEIASVRERAQEILDQS